MPTSFWFLVPTFTSCQKKLSPFTTIFNHCFQDCFLLPLPLDPQSTLSFSFSAEHNQVSLRSYLPGLGQAERCWNTWEAISIVTSGFQGGHIAAFTLLCKNHQIKKVGGSGPTAKSEQEKIRGDLGVWFVNKSVLSFGLCCEMMLSSNVPVHNKPLKINSSSGMTRESNTLFRIWPSCT